MWIHSKHTGKFQTALLLQTLAASKLAVPTHSGTGSLLLALKNIKSLFQAVVLIQTLAASKLAVPRGVIATSKLAVPEVIATNKLAVLK